MRSLFFVGVMFILVPTTFFSPFAGTLIWWWVSLMSPHQVAWGLGSAIPFAMIVAVVTLLCLAMSSDRKLPPLTATTFLILLFFFCITTTTLLSPIRYLAFDKWLAVSKSLLFVCVTIALLTNRVRVQALIWVMVVSIAYYGVWGGLIGLASGGGSRVVGPPNSMIEDNNHLATALVMTLPLINYLRGQSRVFLVRTCCWIIFAACLIAVLGTYSRGGLLALIAMSAFLWLGSRRKLVGGAVLAAGLLGAMSFMPDQWFQRIETVQTYDQDASANERLEMWEVAWAIAQGRPLTGGGFLGPYTASVVDQYAPGSPARAVHSIYLEVLGEHGFPTLAVWLALLIAAMLNCIVIARRTRRRPDLAWANQFARMSLASLIGYAVGGAFLSLSYWDFYFLLVAAVAAVRYIAEAALARGEPLADGDLVGIRGRAREAVP